jgi:hypothetical protein
MSKGSTQRGDGEAYRRNYPFTKKGNAMPTTTISERPADVIAWMHREHPGLSPYQVIARLREQLHRQSFPGVDIDLAHQDRRRDAGSGQPLQFYEGEADRRSEAVPGGLPDMGGA